VVHTGRVIALPLDTVATIGSVVGVAIALFVALRSEFRQVNARIDALDHRMTDRIDSLEHKLTDRIDRLDDRVYALAAGLKPQVEAARGDVAPS
jgi:hypothetical protein